MLQPVAWGAKQQQIVAFQLQFWVRRDMLNVVYIARRGSTQIARPFFLLDKFAAQALPAPIPNALPAIRGFFEIHSFLDRQR